MDKTLANTRVGWNIILWQKVTNFTPNILVFYNYCQHCLQYILHLFNFIAFFHALQVIISSRLLRHVFWFDEFFNSLGSAKSQFPHAPQNSWGTFSQAHVLCKQPHMSIIHSFTFTRSQCSHSRSSIQSDQHSCYLLFAPTHLTLAEPHFVYQDRRKSQFKSSFLSDFWRRGKILKSVLGLPTPKLQHWPHWFVGHFCLGDSYDMCN